MPKKDDGQRREQVLRWFCGVPVLANPLILIDLVCAAVIMWFVTVTLVVLAQVTLGDGPLLGAHIAAACVYATYVALLLPLMYVVVCLLFFRRGYVVLYRLERAGLFMETMRGAKLKNGGLFTARPFPVDEVLDPQRSVTREIVWHDVRSFRELRSMRVIQLMGRWGTVAKIYCPDDTIYRAALDFVAKKVTPRD